MAEPPSWSGDMTQGASREGDAVPWQLRSGRQRRRLRALLDDVRRRVAEEREGTGHGCPSSCRRSLRNFAKQPFPRARLAVGRRLAGSAAGRRASRDRWAGARARPPQAVVRDFGWRVGDGLRRGDPLLAVRAGAHGLVCVVHPLADVDRALASRRADGHAARPGRSTCSTSIAGPARCTSTLR